MKKFSELTEKDLEDIDTVDLMKLEVMLDNCLYLRQIVDKSIKNINYTFSNESGIFIASIVKSSVTGRKLIAEYTDFKGVADFVNFDPEEFLNKLYELDEYKEEDIDRILDEDGNISNINMVFTDGKIYVNADYFYKLKYVQSKSDKQIIEKSDYSWFGKIDHLTLSNRVIGDIEIHSLVDTFIKDCKIKTLKIIDDKFIGISFSRIKDIHITLSRFFLSTDFYKCEIDNLQIDITNVKIDEHNKIGINTEDNNIKNIKIISNKAVNNIREILDIKDYSGRLEFEIK